MLAPEYVEQLEPGDPVEVREAPPATKWRVMKVSDQDDFVLVKWEVRYGMEGRVSTHPANHLRKLPQP